MSTNAGSPLAGSEQRTAPADWTPQIGRYESTLAAKEALADQLRDQGDIGEFVDSMRSTATSYGEALVADLPVLLGVPESNVFGAEYVVDVGEENYDIWSYVIIYNDDGVSYWDVRRYYFGPDFSARGIPLRVTDFEFSRRGWEALRDAILEQVGEPVRIEQVQAVMQEHGFKLRDVRRGKAGTVRADEITYRYFIEFPNDVTPLSRLTPDPPYFAFSWKFSDSGVFRRVLGASRQ